MGSLGVEVAEKKAMWLYPKVMGFNPSERWGHSACYSQGILYVFGGCCGGLHFSDVLLLNLDTMVWNALVSTGQGPGPRDSHSAVVVGQRMIVFGGTNGSKKVNDLHILDFATKEWIQPECNGTPPSPRESHTATLVSEEKLVIFGGSGEGEGNYLNDLHILDLKTMTWTSPEVKGDIPIPRDSHNAVAIGNKLFVYGGDCGDRYNGDVDMLDINTLTWSRLSVQGSSPGVRAGHAAVNIGTKVYVIGGVGDKHYYNDVWILDVSTCSWMQLDIRGQQPQGRFSHTAIVTDLDIAIYGGCGEDERPLNELLVLQLGAEHPTGRYNISMCKIFGNHWNQERRSSREGNNMKAMILGNNAAVREHAYEPESESKRPLPFNSDTLHPKRRRTTTAKTWDVESEQEEHSLSLSHSSSPSLSDQEQTATQKAADSATGSQGFHLFKKLSEIPSNDKKSHNASSKQKEAINAIHRTPKDLHLLGECHSQPSANISRNSMQFSEQKFLDAGSLQNAIGAEVRGKVDGAFDSGYLMTATVNGKLFRGVLFAPGLRPTPRGPILAQNPHMALAQPLPNHSNHLEPRVRLFQQPMKSSSLGSGQSFPHQVARPFPVFRASSSNMPKEPSLRSDLQGVVLTLGGPGSSQH
ncbi:acyl-CoA-binding domain-containing protein 4 [Morus notabilis]|uniref:acyl-CoA-binding domain-containing protein 4 n=1 Tax=Morus notabilis TaxID=981085 RepID=UPI000CED25D8|nr:acyl-CoA-binding domain-containing protein 4 [Morus notabilis]